MQVTSKSFSNHAPLPPDKLAKAARDLEAVFVAEMLTASGLNQTSKSFGGGAGEDQFQSLLIRAQADAIVEAGGIGLAESLYLALTEKKNV